MDTTEQNSSTESSPKGDNKPRGPRLATLKPGQMAEAIVKAMRHHNALGYDNAVGVVAIADQVPKHEHNSSSEHVERVRKALSTMEKDGFVFRYADESAPKRASRVRYWSTDEQLTAATATKSKAS